MMSISTVKTTKNIPFGCDYFGRLQSVLVHTPGKELNLINKKNFKHWLFDRVPNVDKYREEHLQYLELLQDHGVQVYELEDYVYQQKDLLRKLPNITFMHDIAVISQKGAFLSAMAWEGRFKEEMVIKEALLNLGIPILHEFKGKEEAFEGLLILSDTTLLIANTERHKFSSILKFMGQALTHYKEIIYVNIPDARRYMHPDTIYNRVSHNLAIAYLPALKDSYLFTKDDIMPIDIQSFLKKRGIDIIGVSDSEQQRLACTFVPLEPGVIFHYDTALDTSTQKQLAKKGVELILFHPEELNAGGGSLRCHTMRLHRK